MVYPTKGGGSSRNDEVMPYRLDLENPQKKKKKKKEEKKKKKKEIPNKKEKIPPLGAEVRN